MLVHRHGAPLYRNDTNLAELKQHDRAAEDPKLIAIVLGCLDDPNLIKPESHAFTSTQVSWCEMDDGLPRHAEDSPELRKLWAEMGGWHLPE